MTDLKTLRDYVNFYRSIGFNILPVGSGTKKPAVLWKEYQNRTATDEEIERWFSTEDYGICVVNGKTSGNHITIDFDFKEPLKSEEDVKEALKVIKEILPDDRMLNTMTVLSYRSVKLHYFVDTDKELPKRSFKVNHPKLAEIDVLGEGSIDVLPPTTHPSGIKYRFVSVNGTVPKPLTISEEDYNRVIASFEELTENGRPQDDQKVSRVNKRELTDEQINQIIEAVKPFWKEGRRHRLSLGLGGLFYYSGISLETALNVISKICEVCGDEEIRDRQRAVEDSYKDKETAYKPFFDGPEEEKLLEELSKILRLHELWCEIKTATRKNGIYKEYFQVTPEGVYLIGVIKRDGDNWKIVKREIVISKPIRFTREFVGSDTLRFEVYVGNEQIVGTLKEIKEELQNLGVVAKVKYLDDALSRILETSRAKGIVRRCHAYEVTGIFEVDGKLKIVHPALGDEVFPHNPIARKITEVMSYFKNDEKGETAKLFAKLITGLKPEYRLIIAGYTAIAPFTWILKNNYGFDVTPHLMIYRRKGTGKTQTLTAFTRNLYGVKTFTGDDMRSEFRFMNLVSSTTFPILVDEVGGKITSQAVDILKASSTGATEGHRGLKSQKIKSYPLMSPLCMTANRWDWGDSALREGRIIAIPTDEKISDLTDEEFTDIKLALEKSKKLFGLFLLKTVIEKIASSGADILELILNEELRVKKELEGIEVCDSRRYRMYALLRVGYRFWIQALLEALDEKEWKNIQETLEEPLKPEKFREIVVRIETEIREDKKLVLEGIKTWLAYLKNRYESEGETEEGWLNYHNLIKHTLRTGEDVILITRVALGEYNEFARKRGYPTFTNLKALGELVADILNRSVAEVCRVYKIEGKTIRAVGIPKSLIFD